MQHNDVRLSIRKFFTAKQMKLSIGYVLLFSNNIQTKKKFAWVYFYSIGILSTASHAFAAHN